MELQDWRCTRCDTTFKSGQWVGCRGIATETHEVAAKTYYSVATPFLLKQWKTDRKMPDQAGRLISIGGKSAQFKDGHFSTTDPEEQEHMDSCVANGALQTAEQYADAILTPQQKLARQKIQLEESSRLVAKLQEENRKLQEQGVVAQHAQESQESDAPKTRRQPARV